MSWIIIIFTSVSLVSLVIANGYFYRKINNQKNELTQLTKQQENLKTNLFLIKSQRDSFQEQFDYLANKSQEIANEINSNTKILDNQKETLNAQKELLEHQKEIAEKELRQAQEALNAEFLKVQKEFTEQFSKNTSNKMTTARELAEQITKMRATIASAVEVAKRDAQEKEKQNFYRLQLTQEQIDDIKALRSIENKLSNPEAINKVIWKVYYEKPYTDLIGRLGLTTTKCGIYKITNIENKMCYVGQSADIGQRIKQHIKRGVGAEQQTQNKLYPVMKSIGPENFTFEIIQECSRAELNEREQYWQEFYKAKEFGYSIK